MKPKIAIGQRYGRLVVLEINGGKGKTTARCVCDCGAKKTIFAYKLTLKNCATKSCGCSQHVRGLPSTYGSWKSMKERCTTPSYHGYKYYGGKGIKVDPRWLGKKGFENFVSDLGERPEGRTLDRVDSEGDYTKKNCRWATAEEQSRNRKHSTAYHVRRMLESLGLDLNDPNLRGTAARVERSLRDELLWGYSKHPADYLLTTFPSGNDQMVILRDIPFYSTCSHHLLPFHGKAHVGYVPNGKVVGLSKLARVVEVYARRLQLQENLTDQIVEAVVRYLKPLGAMVIIEAEHSCMTCRGVAKQGATMATSAVRGVFTKPEARAEFMALVKP